MTHNHSDCEAAVRAIRASEGCEESRLALSRRSVVGGISAGLFSWAFMPKFAEAATGGARLLVVVLRGGMDGINVCVPFGDPHYRSMRGNIAIPASSTIRIPGNSFFGLHPAMRNFGRMFNAREAAVVHATCVPLRNRSHFDAQDNLENGMQVNGQANPTGWLNRMLGALPQGAAIRTAGAIEIGEAPLILRGPEPVLGWSPTWFDSVDDPLLYLIRTLYRERDGIMYDTLDRGLKAHRLASRVDKDDGSISELRKAFRGAGRLIAAPDGPRIAVLTVGGWDTHADQGGQLTGVLTELDNAINDFKTVVAGSWKSTVVAMATEFGRTVRVNGNNGTDHGVGTVALLAGGAVNGGKVFGDWPGLAPNQLYEGSDLRATTDLRSIWKGILRDHIGVPPNLLNTTIFPDSGSAPVLSNLIDSGSADVAPEIAGTSRPVSIRMDTPIAKYRRARKTA